MTDELKTEDGKRGHIVAFSATNYLKLRLVDLKFDSRDGEFVEIIGKNAQGKTSLLKAIASVLMGPTAYPDNPIRDGEEKAVLEMETDEHKIKLSFHRLSELEKGKPYLSKLEVWDKNRGIKRRNERTLLKDLIGKDIININPTEFIDMTDKKRLEYLCKIIEMPIDLAEWEIAYKKKYDTRRDANVKATSLEKAIGEMPDYPDVPVEKIDISELSKALDVAQEKISKHRDLKVKHERFALEIGRLENEVKSKTERVEKLQLEVAEVEALIDKTKQKQAASGEEVEISGGKLPDTKAITMKIQTANEINEKVTANIELAKRREGAEASRNKHAEFDDELKAHIDKRREALSTVKFPVEGLSLADPSEERTGNEMIYNGKLFRERSYAEQITICMRLAMAKDTKLPIILIDEGANLDPESKKIVANEIIENGFLGIMAGVMYDDNQSGIVISNGRVDRVNK